MPLFNYVWQYQNVTIEDFAQEVAGLICPCSGTASGPSIGVNSADYIPVSNGSIFVNSWLKTKDAGNNDYLATIFPGFGEVGFLLQPFINRYTFGECDPAATGFAGKVVIDNLNQYAAIGGEGVNSFAVGVNQNGIVLNGNGSITAGASSGVYLEVFVNNVPYKLELLNP